MGVSTYCIIWLLWLCKTKQAPRGIIYWLPTDSAVGDFVNTKLDPFVGENEDNLRATNNMASRSAQNQGLKFLYNVPTFWRGLKSKTKVKSISADAAVYDEFDEADPEQVTQARKRLSASEVKLTRDLSTPTIPDFGIDKRFQESDQCHYAFKCQHCSTWNILEENFPHCFQQDINGDYFHACSKCKLPLDVTQGTWIQKESRNKIRGYQISQLYSPFVSPNEIMHDYHTTQFMGHFFNHVLGLPWISATDRVTKEHVFSCCDPLRSLSSGSIKGTVIGVDVGSKLHMVVIEPSNIPKLICVDDLDTWEELDKMMLKFNCKQIVIDAMPELHKVRDFIAKHKSKSYKCFYNENQKGSFSFDEETRIVTVNRTESLDVGTDMIINKKISIPQRCPKIEEFAQHCENIVKVAEDDKDTGARKYNYRRLGPDHYRHALNYCLIAMSNVRIGPVTGYFR